MSRLVLDAGAFIAFERGDVRVRARLAAARRLGFDLVTSSPAIGQVWRNGRQQALLARLLPAVRVDAPSEAVARQAGELLAKTNTSDIVDGLVACLARHGDTVLTSDADDLKMLLTAAAIKAIVIAT